MSQKPRLPPTDRSIKFQLEVPVVLLLRKRNYVTFFDECLKELDTAVGRNKVSLLLRHDRDTIAFKGYLPQNVFTELAVHVQQWYDDHHVAYTPQPILNL